TEQAGKERQGTLHGPKLSREPAPRLVFSSHLSVFPVPMVGSTECTATVGPRTWESSTNSMLSIADMSTFRDNVPRGRAFCETRDGRLTHAHRIVCPADRVGRGVGGNAQGRSAWSARSTYPTRSTRRGGSVHPRDGGIRGDEAGGLAVQDR